MPRFFFTTDDGSRVDSDDEGIEFKDEESAVAQAQIALTDMVRERLPDGRPLCVWVSVWDQARREIYRASLTFNAERPPLSAGGATGPPPAKSR